MQNKIWSSYCITPKRQVSTQLSLDKRGFYDFQECSVNDQIRIDPKPKNQDFGPEDKS